MTGRTIIFVRQKLVALRLLPELRWHAPSETGSVYAIHDDSFVKIGFISRSPRQRFRDCFPINHLREQFCFAHSAPTFSMRDEHQAHTDLTAYKYRGEWFRRSSIVKAYLHDNFGITLEPVTA